MADENNLNELQGLMQQIAKSTKSMADNMQTQTSRQEKLLLNEAAKSDAKRTEEFHKEQQKKLQELGGFGEEQKDIDEQSLDLQKEMLAMQSKNVKEQASASQYLQTLAKLTEQNREELTKLSDPNTPSRGFLGGAATKLAGVKGAFEPATRSGLGVVGDVAGIGSNLAALTKIGKESIGSVFSGSRKRQKRIEETRKQINDQNIAISAEKFELSQATKEGDKNRISKARESLKNSQDELKRLGTTLSKDVSDEFMRQKKKSDPNFLKGFDSKRMGLIKNQQRSNILDSVMEGGGFGNSKSMLNARTSLGMKRQEKAQAAERREDFQEQAGSMFMATPISPSDSPSTYGEYVAATYNETEDLNKNITQLSNTFKEGFKDLGGQGSGSGGFGITSLLGNLGMGLASRFLGRGLLGSLGKIFGGKKTKMGRFFRDTQANKIRRERDKMRKGPSKIGKMFRGLGKSFRGIGSGLMKSIRGIGPMLMNAVRGIGPMLMNAVRGIGPMLLKGVASLGTGLLSALTSSVGGLLSAGAAGIATTVGAVGASALGGLAVGDWLANKLGFAEDGTTVGDIGTGLISFVKGDGFMSGLEENQIERFREIRESKQRQKEKSLGKSSTAINNTSYMSRGQSFNLSSGPIEDSPLTSQRAFGTQTSLDSTGAISSAKVTEYQMLAKMIASENLKIQTTEMGKTLAKQKADFNASATSKQLGVR